MQVLIDGAVYEVDLKQVSEYLKAWYNANKHTADTILLEKGKTVDFSRKSLARIGFKTLMTPILIPMIHMMYTFKKATPPKKEKHEDLLDWTALSFLGFLGELNEDKLYVESMEDHNGNSRLVKSIATYESTGSRELVRQGDIVIENTEVSTGREACVPGGEVGNGEDLPLESFSQEETGSTTVAERILVGHEETG